MEAQQNNFTDLGHLAVSIIDEKKSSKLTVDGTFPTNGERPMFRLEKNDPQGINEKILLLTLNFGSLVIAGGKGTAQAFYSETLTTRDQYSSVQVVDSNSRTLATAEVSQ